MPSTMVDVANRSGVSTATVSRVLSGASPARPETRDRVIAAARELDYRPSAVARALKRRETRTLGLLVTDIENHSFRRSCALERRVDGIVVASSRVTRRHAALLARAPIPVVLVNSEAPRSGLPAIDTFHRRGARMATEHLLVLGHRVLGHVTAPAANAAAGLRLGGVRDAIRAAGIEAESLHMAEGDGHVAGGERAAEKLQRRARRRENPCAPAPRRTPIHLARSVGR